MGKLHHEEYVCPIVLLVVHIEPEILFEALVSPFRLPICLWVECCGHVLFDPEHLTEISCKFSREAQIPITDDIPRESEAFEDMR